MLLVSQSLGILPTPISTLNPHIPISTYLFIQLASILCTFYFNSACFASIPPKYFKNEKKKFIYTKFKIKSTKSIHYHLYKKYPPPPPCWYLQGKLARLCVLLLCFCVFQRRWFFFWLYFSTEKNIVYVLWKIYICNGFIYRTDVCMYVCFSSGIH